MISLCYRKSTEPLQYWRLESGIVLVFEGNAHTEYSEQEFANLFEPVNAALHVTEKALRSLPTHKDEPFIPASAPFDTTGARDYVRSSGRGCVIIDPSR